MRHSDLIRLTDRFPSGLQLLMHSERGVIDLEGGRAQAPSCRNATAARRGRMAHSSHPLAGELSEGGAFDLEGFCGGGAFDY